MAAQTSWANEALAVTQPRFFEVEDATSAEAGLDDELLGLRLEMNTEYTPSTNQTKVAVIVECQALILDTDFSACANPSCWKIRCALRESDASEARLQHGGR